MSAPNAFADAARHRKAHTIVGYLMRRLIQTVKEQPDEGWLQILTAAEVKAERVPSDDSKALIFDMLERLERIHRILL